MTYSTNDRVYVSAPLRRGAGTVLRTRRGDVVEVCLDVGQVVRVGACHVRHLERQRPPASSLTRRPAYERVETVAVERREPFRSPHYLAWIRQHDCAWCGKAGPSEASHHPAEGHGGMGTKADDHDVVPLCHGCHAHWHQHTRLGSMTSADSKAWAARQAHEWLKRWVRETVSD